MFELPDTVARIGGDEFVIILEQIVDRKKLSEKIEYIFRKKLKNLLELMNLILKVGASIGIALFPEIL